MNLRRVVRSRFRDYPLIDLRKAKTSPLSFGLRFWDEMRILSEHVKFTTEPYVSNQPTTVYFVPIGDQDMVSVYDGQSWKVVRFKLDADGFSFRLGDVDEGEDHGRSED